MEPEPSNISGEVVHRHAFEHRINWGHVALALAGLAVAYLLLASSEGADLESYPGADSESAGLEDAQS